MASISFNSIIERNFITTLINKYSPLIPDWNPNHNLQFASGEKINNINIKYFESILFDIFNSFNTTRPAEIPVFFEYRQNLDEQYTTKKKVLTNINDCLINTLNFSINRNDIFGKNTQPEKIVVELIDTLKNNNIICIN